MFFVLGGQKISLQPHDVICLVQLADDLYQLQFSRGNDCIWIGFGWERLDCLVYNYCEDALSDVHQITTDHGLDRQDWLVIDDRLLRYWELVNKE